MTDEGSNGDALARLVATSLASILVAAVLAAGAHLWALSESLADTRANVAAIQASADQLRDALGCDTGGGDLHRLCVRIERAEQRIDALDRSVSRVMQVVDK